jgi:hypothetical protein
MEAPRKVTNKTLGKKVTGKKILTRALQLNVLEESTTLDNFSTPMPTEGVAYNNAKQQRKKECKGTRGKKRFGERSWKLKHQRTQSQGGIKKVEGGTLEPDVTSSVGRMKRKGETRGYGELKNAKPKKKERGRCPKSRGRVCSHSETITRFSFALGYDLNSKVANFGKRAIEGGKEN